MSRKKLANSSSVRRSPSISASISLVTRSSCGSAAAAPAQIERVLVEGVGGGRVERQQPQRRRVAVRVGRQRRARRTSDEMVRQLDHQAVVGFGHAENVADHTDRDRLGDELDPVAPTGGRELVERCSHPVADGRCVRLHVPRGERRADEAPEPGVDRWVHVDHRGPGVERILVDVVDLDVADRRRKRLRGAADGDDVGVAGDDPVAVVDLTVDGVPDEAGRVPDRGERSVRDAVGEDGGIGQVDGRERPIHRQPITNGSRVAPSSSTHTALVSRNSLIASAPLSRP